MAVTLTQLSAFLTVVRRGSVTAAAEELFVTQPSVSAAVAALEREVGAKLLERDGRGLRPTDAGTAFAPYAAHVLGLLEQGERAAREAAEGGRTMLRISAVTSAGDHVVPQLIRAFRDAHPELDLVLHIGNRARGLRGPARPPGRRRDHRPRARRRAARGGGVRGQRDRARDGARRPAGQAALGRGRGARRPAVAAARAGLRLARDGGGVAAPARARAAGADAGVEHGRARGRARGARDRPGLAHLGRAGAEHGPARHDPPARRAAAAPVVRRAVDGRPAAAGGRRVRGVPGVAGGAAGAQPRAGGALATAGG